ncbi:hypothetical protein PMIN05_006563 [Paraphaeosphaeria minitans]
MPCYPQSAVSSLMGTLAGSLAVSFRATAAPLGSIHYVPSLHPFTISLHYFPSVYLFTSSCECPLPNNDDAASELTPAVPYLLSDSSDNSSASSLTEYRDSAPTAWQHRQVRSITTSVSSAPGSSMSWWRSRWRVALSLRP